MFLNRSALPLVLGMLCLFGAVNPIVAQTNIDNVCTTELEFSTNFFPYPKTCIDVVMNEFGDLENRCYQVYTPNSCSMEEKKVPVVVDIHGSRGCPYVQTAYSGWLKKAEEECFVVVYPHGHIPESNANIASSCWKVPGLETADGTDIITQPCCCANGMQMPSLGNDALFIKAAIEDVLENYDDSNLELDADRVYLAGHSNGCMASLSVAAQFSDTIAAVCCHAGALLTPFPEDYTPVPIWLAHGVKDPTIEYDGEFVEQPPVQKIGFWSIPDTVDYLGTVNQCDGDIEESDILVEEVSIGTVLKTKGCKNGAKVEVLALDESGHFPYKLPDDIDQAILLYLAETGETPTTYDTTAKAWEFCSAHKRKEGKVGKVSKSGKSRRR